MFSYLRPSNRRSAVPSTTAPPQATSSRYYHEAATSPHPSSSDYSHPPSRTTHNNGFIEASPVSPDPPILPPIPRVASHLECNTLDAEGFWGPDQGNRLTPAPHPQPQPQESTSKPSKRIPNTDQPPSIATKGRPDTGVSGARPITNTAASERPLPTQSKRNRPIDSAYESMRAYSEPPRPRSFGNTPDNVPFVPQPSREPPPPPPKLLNPQPPPQRQAPPPPTKTQTPTNPTAIQKNHGKAKLNLLNPMSLLARRRSAQVVEEAYSQNQSNPRLPDDFDPRIRGKVVHDFSAPRPSRPVSSNEAPKESEGLSESKRKRASPNGRNATNQDDHSPSSTEKEYIPVFKENFDDNVEPWSNEMDSPAKRQSSAFMYQLSLQASQSPDPSSLPAFARNLPSKISNDIDALRKASSPPPKPHLEILLEPPAANQKSATSSPPTSPPTTRSRATSINDPSSQTPGAPQRFKSNASRFSFDLAGVGSAAQEKLLEEKHRQKAKQRERESVQSNDQDLDDDGVYADYDDMEDDGLEERIPGVNADAEDFDMPVLQQTLENIQFISPNKSSFDSVISPVSTGLTSPATPRDAQGQCVGLLASKSSPDLLQVHPVDPQVSSTEGALRPKSTPEGITDPGFNVQVLQREVASEANLAGLPQRYDCQDDDDMYFDDGMIEDYNDDGIQPFDESVFDDDTNRVYGLPLRDLKPLPAPLDRSGFPDSQPSNNGELGSQTDTVYRNLGNTVPQLKPSSDGDMVAELRDSVVDLDQPARTTSTSHTAGLTQDNLGLHDRLAFAANQAALEGRFNRTYSQASTRESHDAADSSQGTTTQDNHLKSQLDGLLLSGVVNDDNDFAFDDANMAFTEAEDDDPIIAAANAEALENDDEGFYGQEFGFFARKPGSIQAEYANGGYFGARALESVHRMNSGRDNFLEPSLTPITERSEWSNRNSMISLGMHGFPLSSQYQSNPQLTDLMRVQEGQEMSLEQLRKLRRSAWGGSNGSLQSSSNSPNGGSPLTYLPPGMVAPLMQASNSNGSLISPNGQNLAGSFHSFSSGGHGSSNDSNPSPSGGSPTITISPSQSGLMLQSLPQPLGPPPPPPAADTSPVKRSAMNPPKTAWVPGHSRTSSGAESVSYREENGRWFCEKTRLIDEVTGEVEVLGRSVIEGGRI